MNPRRSGDVSAYRLFGFTKYRRRVDEPHAESGRDELLIASRPVLARVLRAMGRVVVLQGLWAGLSELDYPMHFG